MTAKAKAIIIMRDGKKKQVFLQQEGDTEGGFWATSKPENSNHGWHLHGNGKVFKQRYHARTNERLFNEQLFGATWKPVVEMSV